MVTVLSLSSLCPLVVQSHLPPVLSVGPPRAVEIQLGGAAAGGAEDGGDLEEKLSSYVCIAAPRAARSPPPLHPIASAPAACALSLVARLPFVVGTAGEESSVASSYLLHSSPAHGDIEGSSCRIAREGDIWPCPHAKHSPGTWGWMTPAT